MLKLLQYSNYIIIVMQIKFMLLLLLLTIALYFSHVSACRKPYSVSMTKEQMDTSKSIKTRIILAFGLVGFLVDFNFFTLQSAAQDILEATNIPTAWVSLAITGPAGLVSALYPYVFERVPDSVACLVIFIASVAGILLTSLVQDLRVRLAGACLVSFGIGSTESIFISLSSFYGGNTITSYGLGTAISFVAGPLSYAGGYNFCFTVYEP